MEINNLTTEWTLLQNQYDSYEKYSLVIKLVCLYISANTLISEAVPPYLLAVIAIFWLLDAIWKTFQSRIEIRLLTLERVLAEQSSEITTMPYQFNTEFAKQRPSGTALIAEYLKQALRPTIAFPYALLVLVSVITLI